MSYNRCCPECGEFNAFHGADFVKCYICGQWLGHEQVGVDMAGLTRWNVFAIPDPEHTVPDDIYNYAEAHFARFNDDAA